MEFVYSLWYLHLCVGGYFQQMSRLEIWSRTCVQNKIQMHATALMEG